MRVNNLTEKTAAFTFAILLMMNCAWAQTGTILYNFSGGKDGKYPKARLLLDKSGNLYGTTTAGGAYRQGEVFSFRPTTREDGPSKCFTAFKEVPTAACPRPA